MFMVMDKTNVALNKVQSVVYLFYQYSFTNGDKGTGAALVVILLVFIMIITVILQKAEKKFVYHN
jgi:multiple sugar transport system permease protein